MALALVTGASRGIGKAVAVRLASRGYTVALMSRTAADLEALAAEHANMVPVPLDVTDFAAVKSVVEELEAAHGPVAVLVNNAGYGLRGVMEEVDFDQWRAEFELNLFAAMHLVQCVLPGMRAARSGIIVQLSSVAARVSVPLSGPYCATKFALKAASDALRVEVAPFGIDVVQIEPGPVATDFAAVAREFSAARLDDERSPYASVYTQFAEHHAKLHASAWSADAVADLVMRSIERPAVRVAAYSALLRASVFLSSWLPRLHDRVLARRMGFDQLG